MTRRHRHQGYSSQPTTWGEEGGSVLPTSHDTTSRHGAQESYFAPSNNDTTIAHRPRLPQPRPEPTPRPAPRPVCVNPACPRGETAYETFRDAGQLTDRPRPEPTKADTAAHQEWEKEYEVWDKVKCQCGTGYFCRAHARWISGGEIKSHKAYDKANQHLGCPDSHYDQPGATIEAQEDVVPGDPQLPLGHPTAEDSGTAAPHHQHSEHAYHAHSREPTHHHQHAGYHQQQPLITHHADDYIDYSPTPVTASSYQETVPTTALPARLPLDVSTPGEWGQEGTSAVPQPPTHHPQTYAAPSSHRPSRHESSRYPGYPSSGTTTGYGDEANQLNPAYQDHAGAQAGYDDQAGGHGRGYQDQIDEVDPGYQDHNSGNMEAYQNNPVGDTGASYQDHTSAPSSRCQSRKVGRSHLEYTGNGGGSNRDRPGRSNPRQQHHAGGGSSHRRDQPSGQTYNSHTGGPSTAYQDQGYGSGTGYQDQTGGGRPDEEYQDHYPTSDTQYSYSGNAEASRQGDRHHQWTGY